MHTCKMIDRLSGHLRTIELSQYNTIRFHSILTTKIFSKILESDFSGEFNNSELPPCIMAGWLDEASLFSNDLALRREKIWASEIANFSCCQYHLWPRIDIEIDSMCNATVIDAIRNNCLGRNFAIIVIIVSLYWDIIVNTNNNSIVWY